MQTVFQKQSVYLRRPAEAIRDSFVCFMDILKVAKRNKEGSIA